MAKVLLAATARYQRHSPGIREVHSFVELTLKKNGFSHQNEYASPIPTLAPSAG